MAAVAPSALEDSLHERLAAQRRAFEADGFPALEVRRDRLSRALDLLLTHQRELCEAAAQDFGQRPEVITRLMDVLPAALALKQARRRVARWMRPQRARIGLPAGAPGARAEIRREPLGVVGIISPWNFPITLSFGPLAGALAAGNRCLLKPSELTPGVSAVLARRIGEYFDAAELAVVTGGPQVASAFAALPFDHLLFTGSTAIGRRVMSAAAENLVPVTLELGGKCPAILGRSARLEQAVDRILLSKLANAGQMCIAPDYVCLPRASLEEFVAAARGWVRRAYPDGAASPDLTALINPAHAQRIEALVADARAGGAKLVPLMEDAGASGRLPVPMLVLDTHEQMRIMQEEIFGPLLPLRPYERIEEALAEISSRPRPLALYYFGSDRGETRFVLEHSHSGGVTVNDVAMHFLAEELPFGGVGASGMGAYHGEHGFERFSHARAVFYQTRLDVAGWVGLRPPYGPRIGRALDWLLRR
jgi:coniferyl-aldehyde dehydrogenase